MVRSLLYVGVVLTSQLSGGFHSLNLFTGGKMEGLKPTGQVLALTWALFAKPQACPYLLSLSLASCEKDDI